MLTDGGGKLVGLFTDSDLARLFESRRDAALDESIQRVMTSQPCTVPAGSMLVDAIAIMAERKISELPVIDEGGMPVGLLDITDVVAVFPDVQPAAGAIGRSAVPAPKFASSPYAVRRPRSSARLSAGLTGRWPVVRSRRCRRDPR